MSAFFNCLPSQLIHDFLNQFWPLVDEAGVELQEGGPSGQLIESILRGHDATDSDDGDAPPEFGVEGRDSLGGELGLGRSREAALLVGMAVALDCFSLDSGVGRDEGVESSFAEDGGEFLDVTLRQIGSDLEGDGHAATGLRGELLALRLQGFEEARGGLSGLQVAQAWGVGRGQIDRDVVRHGIGGPKGDEVVVGGLFIGRDLVLSDVEPHGPLKTLPLAHVGNSFVDSGIIEAHSVDQRLVLGKAEEAGLGIAGLGPGSDGADLDEREPKAAEGVDGVAFLIKSSRESDRVGEGQPHALDWLRGGEFGRKRSKKVGLLGSTKSTQREVVRGLGIKLEEEGLEEGVGGSEHCGGYERLLAAGQFRNAAVYCPSLGKTTASEVRAAIPPVRRVTRPWRHPRRAHGVPRGRAGSGGDLGAVFAKILPNTEAGKRGQDLLG